MRLVVHRTVIELSSTIGFFGETDRSTQEAALAVAVAMAKIAVVTNAQRLSMVGEGMSSKT